MLRSPQKNLWRSSSIRHLPRAHRYRWRCRSSTRRLPGVAWHCDKLTRSRVRRPSSLWRRGQTCRSPPRPGSPAGDGPRHRGDGLDNSLRPLRLSPQSTVPFRPSLPRTRASCLGVGMCYLHTLSAARLWTCPSPYRTRCAWLPLVCTIGTSIRRRTIMSCNSPRRPVSHRRPTGRRVSAARPRVSGPARLRRLGVALPASRPATRSRDHSISPTSRAASDIQRASVASPPCRRKHVAEGPSRRRP